METLFAPHTYLNTEFYSLDGKECWGRLINVHDGDTITVILQNPIGIFYKYNIRLDGIDTSEITSHITEEKDKAIIARNLTIKLLTCDDVILDNNTKYTRNNIISSLEKKVYLVYLKCKNMDKYGRVLADVFTQDDFHTSVNSKLFNSHLAYEYHGGTKKSNTIV
jgi:endonuclease YncB( thermonuclease family)